MPQREKAASPPDLVVLLDLLVQFEQDRKIGRGRVGGRVGEKEGVHAGKGQGGTVVQGKQDAKNKLSRARREQGGGGRGDGEDGGGRGGV